jgi:hypothetical protein
MAVKITVYDETAAIDGYVWKCKNKSLEGLLNALLESGGPGGQDPNPDLTAAENVLKRFPGEIIEVSGYDEAVKGRVY